MKKNIDRPIARSIVKNKISTQTSKTTQNGGIQIGNNTLAIGRNTIGIGGRS